MGIKCNSVHIMPSTEQVLNKMAELSPSFREASFCQGSEDNQSKGNSQLSRRTLSATTSYHLVWDQELSCCVKIAKEGPEWLETQGQGLLVGLT